MAPIASPVAEPAAPAGGVVDRLLQLYEEEKQLYARVLELSRNQHEVLRRGGGLAEVRQMLEAKRRCLEAVRRLESEAQNDRQAWTTGRGGWPVAARARMTVALRTVAKLIEETLAWEEKNDQILLEQARSD